MPAHKAPESITFALTFQECVRAVRFLAGVRPIMEMIAGICFMLFDLSFYIAFGADVVIPFAGIPGVLLILLGGYSYFLLPRIFFKRMQAFGECSLSFFDEYTQSSTPMFTVQVSWKVFKPLRENGEFFILSYINQSNQYFLIPKRAFKNKKEVSDFRAFAQERLRYQKLA